MDNERSLAEREAQSRFLALVAIYLLASVMVVLLVGLFVTFAVAV